MKDVVVIYGPTAVGKSSVAVELAKLIDGEIISADSMQVYKGLDIGSAKITKEEMQGIKHHLIDIKQPNEDYSVAEFCDLAKDAIQSIINKGKTPIIVGGTGLYIKSLIQNYDFGLVCKDEAFRNRLENLSNQDLYNQILLKNSQINIDCNNRQRMIRTLERLSLNQQPKQNKANDYNYNLFAILDERKKIYDRINNRVDKMLEFGILKEVEYLRGLNLPDNALCKKAIGYKEFFPYFDGQKSLKECLELLKQKTRNYAKRQITFLNQFKNIQIVDFTSITNTALNIKQKLENK